MDLLTIEPIEPVPEALPTVIKAHMPDEAELEEKRRASPEHQANRTPSMASIVVEAMSAAADAAASLKSAAPAPATPKKTKAALEVPTEKEMAAASAGSGKEGGGSGDPAASLDKPTANGPTSKVQQRHERHGPLNLTLDLSVTKNLSDLTLGRGVAAGNLAAMQSTNTANHAGNQTMLGNVLPLSEPLSGAPRAGRADFDSYHSTQASSGHGDGAAQSPAAHMLTADLCSPCSSAPRDPQPRDSRDPSGPRAVSAIVTGSPHLPTPTYTTTPTTTCLTLPTPSLPTPPDHLHHHYLCHVRPCMLSNTNFLASYVTINQHAGQITII